MGIGNIHTILSDDFTRPSPNMEKSVYNEDKVNNVEDAKQEKTKFNTDVIQDKYSKNEVVDAIDQLNNTIQIFNKKLRFQYHEHEGQIVVQIINSNTDKVIREIPSKEVLNFIAKLHEMMGIFIDKKQ